MTVYVETVVIPETHYIVCIVEIWTIYWFLFQLFLRTHLCYVYWDHVESYFFWDSSTTVTPCTSN